VTELLRNRVAIVTGGDTGIGKAIALAMSSEGALVVIDYHGDAAPAEQLVSEIESGGGAAIAVAADVSKLDEADRLIEATIARFGKLDVMVNNAGIEEKHPFVEMPFDAYRQTIEVNLTGTWLCAQAAAKQMIVQKRGGRIINISSVHEDLSMPTNAAYCASKGGIRMLTRTIAVELAQYGITVNNVCPGAIQTGMDQRMGPGAKEKLLGEIPLRRMGTPDEVAQMCVYLASDAAAYVTGTSLFIDGGMSKQSGSL